MDLQGAVVYHSKYGNNKKVAEAIFQGLKDTGHKVELVDAKESSDIGEDVAFLVVGSPTRAGKMSSPIKKFLKNKVTGSRWEGTPFAAFGTCLEATCEKGGSSSAKKIKEALEEKGLSPMAEAFEASVTGFKGPLVAECEDRAIEFGRELGASLRETSE